MNFLSLYNILFLEGTGTIPKKCPKPLKTSECMCLRQYCTKPLSSFCVVFIKIFWTFLSLQNIYFEKGTDSLSQFNEGPAPATTKNIIETAPLMGTKGSKISQLLHQSYYFWTHESGSPVGGQLHQFPRLVSNTSPINRFPFLHDYRIILDISVSSEYSVLFVNNVKGTSPFSHGEYLYLQKRIWCVKQYCIVCLFLFCTPS